MGLFARKEHDQYFQGLASDLETYLKPQQIETIKAAYEFAAKAHKGQKRRSGEPYITHPVTVARILASMRMDPETIMAALLHDVIEDTYIDKDTLVEHFGKEVAGLVDGVSKLTQIQFKSRAEAQAENFRKMVLAMAQDIRVIIVKLADRLHNMRTLMPLDAEKRRRIANETLEIYAPIANRLGMNNVRIEYEDRSFAALYPMRHRTLKKAVQHIRGNRKEVLTSMQTSIERTLAEDKIDAEIFGREKHLFSIYQKMKKKAVPLSEVTDVFAFRIIVNDVGACYRALGSVHNLYKPVPGRFKDYIAIPKANGYQSLHTVLFGPFGFPVEIQIRTEDMQNLSESGIAAHWLYKTADGEDSKAHARARGWVNGLLELQQHAGTSLEFIEHVKIDLFSDEVYVFTPNGKILELQAGATAVDFAYAVHTDVGNSCIAAKIDRHLAPLSTKLVNGQTVEIVTAPGARPNPAWLNYVVTGKARSNIRHFLKNQQRSESRMLGERLLDKALAIHELSITDLQEEHIANALRRFNMKDFDALLEEIGLGNRSALLLARYFSMQQDAPTEASPIDAAIPLVIKGTEGMVVSFAKCCHPIPGDPVVGVLSAGRGIVVHTDTCPNTVHLQNKPERKVPIQWEDGIKGEFEVELFVYLENRRGVLAQLAIAIAEMDSNIDKISTEDRDGAVSLCTLTISIHDRVHLARIIKRLRTVKAVLRISRTRQ